MSPADSASRAGDMPEASGDSSSGTFERLMKSIIIFALLLISCMQTYAKPGHPLPEPKLSALEALKLVTEYYQTEYIPKHSHESPAHKKFLEEFIVTRFLYLHPKTAQYPYEHLLPNDDGIEANGIVVPTDFSEGWPYFVVMRHPVQNDHTYTFMITPDKQIQLVNLSI